MKTRRVYLDYAATTPVHNRVAKAMRGFELEYFGNPSSIHREGQAARAKIDFARASIAKFLNAEPQEIIFTSGATEANNLVIQGVVTNYKSRPHVITTLLEHQSVYNQVKELENRGLIEATYIKPNKKGEIRAEQVIKAIKDNTILVSVIFVSNEIGTLLPVREIGQLLPEHVFYHIDAVQAAKFYNLNIEKLSCDFLTISAHKLFGPKGIGALYVKTGTKLSNLTIGGSQEYGRRPGTQNTSGIIGFEKAVELLGSLETRQELGQKISKLRDKLILELSKIPKVKLNGPTGESRTPDNVSLTVLGVDQDALMTALDLSGISASTGSACVSGASTPSHVIQALGLTHGQSATIRLTLSKDTTSTEIDYTIKTLKEIVSKLRK